MIKFSQTMTETQVFAENCQLIIRSLLRSKVEQKLNNLKPLKLLISRYIVMYTYIYIGFFLFVNL